SYTIVATNGGPSTGTGATVADTVPATVTVVAWLSWASAGSTCPAASGSGNLNATVTLAPGGTTTFTVTGNLPATATGTLVNTATVAAAASVTEPNWANNPGTHTETP